MTSTPQQQPKQNNVLKYSGLGIQLVAVCLVLVMGGVWLDKKLGYEHVFVLIGLFSAVFAVIYILIKALK